jgi:hypothetical protein
LPIATVKSQSGESLFLPLIIKFEPTGVDSQERDDSLAFYQSDYIIPNPPPINWNGSHQSCDPGTTDPAFQAAVLKRINYFRAMAGVPAEITFSPESNLKAQAAALLMSVNKDLNHLPPHNWTCYSDLAYEGAGNSNLFLGIYGWDAITGYMQDPGEGNDAVGHRRWILYPQTQVMGSGDVPPTDEYPASNALVVFDAHTWDERPETRDGFVAWPPPGYVPYPVVFPRWSFSYPDADFSETKVYMFQDKEPLSILQAPIFNGYGENTIVWQVEGIPSGGNWPVPTQDTGYRIVITNVKMDESALDFTYEVIIFNPNS